MTSIYELRAVICIISLDGQITDITNFHYMSGLQCLFFSNAQIHIHRVPVKLKTTLLFCKPLPFMGNLKLAPWENQKSKKLLAQIDIKYFTLG